jgi:hypothetical protein
MSTLAAEFRNAYVHGSGPGLAAVFTPIATTNSPHRLSSFYEFTNAQYLTQDLASSLFHGKGLKVSKAEQNAWVNVFAAYWEAVGEVLKCEDRHSEASAAALFKAWKKVAMALNKGYTDANIPAWTLPCMYTVGKFLRTFAIKADNEAASQSSTAFGVLDDVAADVEKNAYLEDGARIINRMFTLCLTDR